MRTRPSAGPANAADARDQAVDIPSLYDRFRSGGPEALEDKPPKPDRVCYCSTRPMISSFSDARGSQGPYINCAHCRKEFESLGSRRCSTDCERAFGERQDNLAVMAEAGIK